MIELDLDLFFKTMSANKTNCLTDGQIYICIYIYGIYTPIYAHMQAYACAKERILHMIVR